MNGRRAAADPAFAQTDRRAGHHAGDERPEETPEPEPAAHRSRCGDAGDDALRMDVWRSTRALLPARSTCDSRRRRAASPTVLTAARRAPAYAKHHGPKPTRSASLSSTPPRRRRSRTRGMEVMAPARPGRATWRRRPQGPGDAYGDDDGARQEPILPSVPAVADGSRRGSRAPNVARRKLTPPATSAALPSFRHAPRPVARQVVAQADVRDAVDPDGAAALPRRRALDA